MGGPLQIGKRPKGRKGIQKRTTLLKKSKGRV